MLCEHLRKARKIAKDAHISLVLLGFLRFIASGIESECIIYLQPLEFRDTWLVWVRPNIENLNVLLVVGLAISSVSWEDKRNNTLTFRIRSGV